MNHPPLYPLCVADDATFWPWQTWTDFSQRTEAVRRATTVIVPIVGFTDWGLGHPLDLEEVLLTNLLKAAIAQRPPAFEPLVLPPLRFVLGAAKHSAFAVDVATAHAFLREVVMSVNASGFRRLLFFNASPWNEELCAAASRDLRIEFGLQIFRMNLGMLNLDLHPKRSQTRREVQTIVTALLDQVPEPPANQPPPPASWIDESITPLTTPAMPLDEARREGAAIFAASVSRIAEVFGHIAQFPPLPRDGQLLTMTPP